MLLAMRLPPLEPPALRRSAGSARWKPLLFRLGIALPLFFLPADGALSARLRAAQPTLVATEVPLAEKADGRWVVVSNHNHTRDSHDGHLTIGELAQAAALEGIEAVVLTDHNSMGHRTDPAFRAPQPVTLIGGEEWSSHQGHAGLIGLEGDRPIEGKVPVEHMLAETRERRGVAIVNHPFLLNLSWRSGDLHEDVGGVEVWNNFWGTPLMGNQQALDWWHGALAEGRRLTAVGGGDYHGHPLSALARPLNLVWARDASAEAVVEGIRQGRVVVIGDPRAPRLDLAIEGARIGETLALPAPREATVRVRVQGGTGRILSLLGPQGLIAMCRVDRREATYELRTHFGPGKGFVRAELRSDATVFQPMQALTNPVWVEAGPDLTAER